MKFPFHFHNSIISLASGTSETIKTLFATDRFAMNRRKYRLCYRNQVQLRDAKYLHRLTSNDTVITLSFHCSFYLSISCFAFSFLPFVCEKQIQ